MKSETDWNFSIGMLEINAYFLIYEILIDSIGFFPLRELKIRFPRIVL